MYEVYIGPLAYMRCICYGQRVLVLHYFFSFFLTSDKFCGLFVYLFLNIPTKVCVEMDIVLQKYLQLVD